MEKIVFASETSYEVATTVQMVYLDKYIIQRRGKYKVLGGIELKI